PGVQCRHLPPVAADHQRGPAAGRPVTRTGRPERHRTAGPAGRCVDPGPGPPQPGTVAAGAGMRPGPALTGFLFITKIYQPVYIKEKAMTSTILLTGATGFIGRWLLRELT